MTSEELNNRLRKICDDSEYKAIGGEKSIPYIGWFWKDIDFEADSCLFGICPDYSEHGKVCFMVKNINNYHEIEIEGTAWATIKQLCIEVAENPCYETYRNLDMMIQSIRKVE